MRIKCIILFWGCLIFPGTVAAQDLSCLDSSNKDVTSQLQCLKTLVRELSSQKAAGLPIGSIVAWHQTDGLPPEGWAICNGDNGTPNLVGKFIRGVGTLQEAGVDPNAVERHKHNVSGILVFGTSKGNDDIGLALYNPAAGQTLTAEEVYHVPPNHRLVYIMKIK